MNSIHILEALTDIDSAYIVAAQQRLGYQTLPQTKKVVSLRRKLLCFSAAVLLLIAGFATAIASNPVLQDLLLDLFPVEEPEIIPPFGPPAEENPDHMAVEQQKNNIGGVIEGTYVHTPEASLARNGIFFICTDDLMMNSGNHFDAYAEENGELVKLEEHTFCQDYVIRGHEIHAEFQWVAYNDSCSFTYIATEAPIFKHNLAGPVNATLMSLAMPNSSYPVLIDLETGELTDVLAGSGAEDLIGIYQAAISPDLSKMLLVLWDDTIYYADLTGKKLYSVNELSGESVDKCILIGNTLACYMQDEKNGAYRIWAIDLTTFQRREIYSGKVYAISGFDITSYWGNMTSGTQFALIPGADGTVCALDLVTGEHFLIDGMSLPDSGTQFIGSPDGEKMLIYNIRAGSNYYESIGVLDFTEKTYVRFSRDNQNDVSEHTVYWFDNDSIIICAEAGDTHDYYVYRLLDPSNVPAPHPAP